MPDEPRPDPFDALGLPPRFELSPRDVRRAWLERSASVHPDRTGPGDAEAARRAAALNDARRTLEDPERRAGALLARLGGPSMAADKSLPPGLLAEFLEVQEAVDEARAAERPLDEYERWARTKRDEHIQRAGELFARASPNDPRSLAAIRTELNAWRYVERLIEQLDPGYRRPGGANP